MARDDDSDWEDYHSGPFCPHWGDVDCEVLCKCGHPCGRHLDVGRSECCEEGCTCEEPNYERRE